MTEIYLIRHAEAEGNLYRTAQGQFESILTDRGWRQVRALEERFRGTIIDAVYTSDLYRCCATASAIYLPRHLKPQCREDLREISLGVWEQQTWGDIAREDPEQLENFRHHMELWKVEGGEAPAHVQERVLKALEEIARENPESAVAVCSHGAAIRLVLAKLQGYSLEELGKTPHGDNTAVSLLRWDGEKLEVVYRDDNSHLQTPRYLKTEKLSKRATALEGGVRFVEEAGQIYPSFTAFWGEQEVGLVQLGKEPGEIRQLRIYPDFRRKGYGVQLIGQAVRYWRPLGAETLFLTLPEDCDAKSFLEDYGFAPKEGGRWEKDIRFDPRYLVCR